MNWPTDIAIAAADVPALTQAASGLLMMIGRYSVTEACAAYLRADDDWSIWVNPKLESYRKVWEMASTGSVWSKGTNAEAARGAPDMQLRRWGDHVDVDHLLPRSWVPFATQRITLVRIWPVWGEVNRSWGAGSEKSRKSDFEQGLIPFPEPRRGIWYAKSAQILKVLGMKAPP